MRSPKANLLTFAHEIICSRVIHLTEEAAAEATRAQSVVLQEVVGVIIGVVQEVVSEESVATESAAHAATEATRQSSVLDEVVGGVIGVVEQGVQQETVVAEATTEATTHATVRTVGSVRSVASTVGSVRSVGGSRTGNWAGSRAGSRAGRAVVAVLGSCQSHEGDKEEGDPHLSSSNKYKLLPN